MLELPVLPLRGSVLFPYVAMPFAVGRRGSRAAVDAANASEDKELLLVAQRDASAEPQGAAELFTIGTRGAVRQVQQRDADGITVVIQGLERVRVVEVRRQGELLVAKVEPAPVRVDAGPRLEALAQEIAALAGRAIALVHGGEAPDLAAVLGRTADPLQLLYAIASMLTLDPSRAQSLLEQDAAVDGLELLHAHLHREVEVLEIRRHIADATASEIGREQREQILRRQLRQIQHELGEESPEQAEAALLRERLEKAGLQDPVRKEVERELERLSRLPPAAAEYQLIRTYAVLLLDLPWTQETPTVVDLPTARRVLDEDHYGLRDVKERILEHLAVLAQNPAARAPILCFVGPPGVGKTSLGQSIARALGRKFERLSLGGMHDEAELRGHRRTYVGAMPGRIVQALRRAGVKNPLIMLDEVDKLGRDFRGDPAAALLEVLDPAQNWQFRDNYLDLPFDLSRVLFITTANTLESIPPPLLDRMELVRLAGYTQDEKREIATRYLVPRQLAEAGLGATQLVFGPGVLDALIRRYTREAGVRQLERLIARLGRKAALRRLEGGGAEVTLAPEQLVAWLGAEPFFAEEARRDLPAGVAVGLAWTEAGGEVLYVEAALLPHRPGLVVTGHLGEVMQESARAAETCMWSRAELLGLALERLKEAGAHVHVPSGAIPKDGPSAGVTIATALASLYSGKPARADTALTGEITITGLVLPVGGIKEKVLAARRAGLERIVMPRGNEKDLRDLEPAVQGGLEIITVERIEQAWAQAVPGIFDAPRRGRAASGELGLPS